MVFHQYLWIFVFVWGRAFCGTRKYQSASMDCSGVIQKIHTRKIRRDQGLVHDEEFWFFMVWGRLTRPNGPSRAQGSSLTGNRISHGSKTLLQRAVLYRHQRNYHGKEDCRARPKKTICMIWLFFLQYIWIFVFVWAHIFCGARKHQSASVDCSGVIQKIHMRKIGLSQGVASASEMMEFMIRGR